MGNEKRILGGTIDYYVPCTLHISIFHFETLAGYRWLLSIRLIKIAISELAIEQLLMVLVIGVEGAFGTGISKARRRINLVCWIGETRAPNNMAFIQTVERVYASLN
jgi:hypothetical protein